MNYYEILEVSTNASKEVIKNAYRALIKKYHPDSYTGNKQYAENKLKKINEAYEVLSDDKKRLLYDYDNGFKIDPNAPKEEVKPSYSEKTEENNIQPKNSKKSNTNEKIDFKDKIIELFKNRRNIVICVVSLFLVAFIFGFIISSPSNDKEEEEQKEKVTVNEDKDDDKQDTTVDKNYNYNNNYNNYNQKENNNTYQDTPSNNVDNEYEQDNENTNVDIPENNNPGIS